VALPEPSRSDFTRIDFREDPPRGEQRVQSLELPFQAVGRKRCPRCPPIRSRPAGLEEQRCREPLVIFVQALFFVQDGPCRPCTKIRVCTRITKSAPKLRTVTYGDSSSRRLLSHRALAALRAISFLLSEVSFSARAGPPFFPPSLATTLRLSYPTTRICWNLSRYCAGNMALPLAC
jgi:hypothetical protein